MRIILIITLGLIDERVSGSDALHEAWSEMTGLDSFTLTVLSAKAHEIS